VTPRRVLVLGPARPEQPPVSILTEDSSLGQVLDCLQDFRSVQLDHPVGRVAVDPGLDQEFDSRLKQPVRKRVIRWNRFLWVIPDVKLLHRLADVGDQNFQVEVAFRKDRAGSSPLHEIQETRHYLPPMGINMTKTQAVKLHCRFSICYP
jgi:hypothetical protein